MTSETVPVPTAERRSWRVRPARALLYVLLTLGGVLMVAPFYWMLATSLQSSKESLSSRPVWVPNRLKPATWGAAWTLGAQAGSPWWGGVRPGGAVTFEVRVRTPASPLPAPTFSFPPVTGFDADPYGDYGHIAVKARTDGPDTVYAARIANDAGNPDAWDHVPLRVTLDRRFQDVRSSLPPDAERAQDAGARLEWQNAAPGLLGYVLGNYRDALRAAPFGRYFLNSLATAVAQTVLGLVVVSMAAFAFARIPFWGREVVFALILASLMIPGELLLVPNYVTVYRLHWTDTYAGLIVPWIASVFGMFLLRQFFLSLPAELFEAAVLDGATYGQQLTRVALPLAVPGLTTFGLFGFLGAWNSLLWPLIVTNRPEMRTLQVGLQSFIGEAGTEYGQLMAASVLVVLPIIVGFFLAQRQFIAGIARSGLK